MKALNDKVAIVTGGGGGIGRAIARRFQALGVKLSLTDINEQALADAAKDLRDGDVLTTRCDITLREDAASLVERTKERFGRVDILVNNAGVAGHGLFEDLSDDEIDGMMAVNVMGVIHCTRAAIPAMKKAGGGSIVTIASLAGIVPEPLNSVYTATKFAVRGLNMTLHLELKKHNITASAVLPDSVKTPMLDREAREGGSALSFVNPPQTPEAVARAVCRAIVKKKMEVYVPWSQGLLCRIAALFPWLIPILWPWFEKKGARNRKKYLAALEQR